jgi:hypothetical protein
MKLIKLYRITTFITSLICILVISLIFINATTQEWTQEGFEIVPLVTDPVKHQVSAGYYQVNDSKMALLPYGFVVDPSNNRQIIPSTKVGINMLKPRYNAPIPNPGEPLPDNFYFATDSSLAVLPPNMLPKIKTIDFKGDPATILFYYDKGYVSETQYYENQYTPVTYPATLPKQVYYIDSSHTLVSFLRYGEIQDPFNGYGKIADPFLNLSALNYNYATSNYRDISNNYDTLFHDDINTIQNQSKLYDLAYGAIKVKDQNGNIVTLPKTNAQDSVTYYNPGDFQFGSSKYVPNYEDSVYLSSIGYRTILGKTPDAASSKCGDMCKAYNDFKIKMDKSCGKSI